jgi:site-specific recombinase XerD
LVENCWAKPLADAPVLAVARPEVGHVLRHTFCSQLAIKGANARSIQKLAGHADLNTTMRYMHLAEDDLRLECEEGV